MPMVPVLSGVGTQCVGKPDLGVSLVFDGPVRCPRLARQTPLELRECESWGL